MRLEQLEYLVAVANDHSMHTASHNLHVSQQNISKAIRQLEDELHTQLFDRTNRGVQLTTDGQKVYTYALNITNQINALRQEFCPSPHAAALTGNITIYLSSGLPHFIDTPLKLLCSQYPALSPILIERDSFDLLNELPQILPEIAIIQLTRQKLLANDLLRSHYHLYLIAEEAIHVYMSPAAKYANAKSISLKTLSTMPLCINTDSPNKLPIYVQTLYDLNVPLNIKFITNTNFSLLNYVQNDLAYGLSTASTFKTIPQHLNFRTVPLKEKVFIAWALLTLRQELSPQSQAFIDIFKTTYCDTLQQLY